MVSGDDKVIGIRPAITARHDITSAQIADTAERTAAYFKALTAGGLSVEAATDMADLFNALLLHQHFGVEWKPDGGMGLLSFLGEE